jgi:hypothetical protein
MKTAEGLEQRIWEQIWEYTQAQVFEQVGCRTYHPVEQQVQATLRTHIAVQLYERQIARRIKPVVQPQIILTTEGKP